MSVQFVAQGLSWVTPDMGNAMASELPSVSVIIPTKDRPCDLELAVRSLFTQTLPPQQLVIVDQSMSEESFLRVKKQYEATAPVIRKTVKLCYVRDINVPGSAVARNRAMEVAEGDIWLFLDDDVELEPDFVEELLAVYLRQPQVSGVSGIITNYTPPSWAFRFWSWTFVRGPFHDERQPIYWNANRLRGAEPIAVSKFTGALMSFRAEAIRGLHFEPYLRGVSNGEDVDFCARLKPCARLVIAPRARLVHKASPIGRSQHHWLRQCARANHYLYRRHWRTGLANQVCFLWLNIGFGLVTLAASLRRGSLTPWRALIDGMREGREAARRVSSMEDRGGSL